jgi:hypothetical protein
MDLPEPFLESLDPERIEFLSDWNVIQMDMGIHAQEEHMAGELDQIK